MSKSGKEIKKWLWENIKNGIPSKSLEEARNKIEEFTAAQIIPNEVSLVQKETKFDNRFLKWEEIKINNSSHKKILFVHGGGGVMGSARTSRPFAITLAKLTGFTVISADYRLAPEYPFPSGINDIKDIYKTLLKENSPEDIIMIGESAGCSLSIAALTLLREEWITKPKGLILITPWASVKSTGGTRNSLANVDPWYNKNSFETNAGEIYGKGFPEDNPLVSPIHANLEGFPKLLIHAASEDIFLDDAIQINKNASKVGVDSKLEIWEGMWHVWHNFTPMLPEAESALTKIKDFIDNLYD